MTLFALRRPPVIVLLTPESTPDRIRPRSLASETFGSAAQARAAAPETCGAAVDVPLKFEYVEPSASVCTATSPSPEYPRGVVLRMFAPGAARWTVLGPR